MARELTMEQVAAMMAAPGGAASAGASRAQPAELSPEDVARMMGAPASAPAPAPAEDSLGRRFGLGVRNVVEGVGALPAMAYDAISNNALAQTARAAAGEAGPVPSGAERIGAGLDALGLPRARTGSEQMIGRVIEGMAGVMPTMGVGAALPVGKRMADMLLAKPGTQLAAGAGAGAASQVAEDAGAGAVGSMAAGLAGGIGGAAIPEAARLGGRLVQGLAAPFRQSGREAIVGDTLLRQSSDPQGLAARLRASLDDPNARLPGSPVTTAQAARDAGLASFEGGLRSDRFSPGPGTLTPEARFQNIDAERNAVRARELPAPAPEAAADQGGRLRELGKDAEGQRRGAVSEAYEGVADESAQFPADPVRGLVDQARGKYFGPGSGGSRELDRISDDLAQGGSATFSYPFMQNVRGRLNALWEDAQAKGDRRLAAAADQIKRGVDDLAERAAAPVRREGVPFTQADIERQQAAEGAAQNPGMAAELRDAGAVPGRTTGTPPKSLVQWLVEQGGVRPDGDMRQLMDGARNRPGLLSNRGMALDQAALRAREAGYFPEHPNRPNAPDTLDRNALLGAVDDHFRGRARYADFAEPGGNRALALEEMQRDLDRNGINADVRDPDSVLRAIRTEADDPTPAGPRGDLLADEVVETPFTPEQARRWKEAQQLRRDLARDFERDETGTAATANMLRRTTPDAQRASHALSTPDAARQVIRALGDEGKVVLRQAFRDRAFKAAAGNNPAAADGNQLLSAPAFGKFWRENREVASVLFPPEHLDRLKLLAADFAETHTADAISRTKGSPTARNLSVGNVVSMMTRGLVDPGNVVAQSLLRPLGWVFQAGEGGVRQLLTEAMADPVLAQRLTASASHRNVEQAVAYINQTMGERIGEALGDAAGRTTLRAGAVSQPQPNEQQQRVLEPPAPPVDPARQQRAEMARRLLAGSGGMMMPPGAGADRQRLAGLARRLQTA